jgi:site-specific recombinase XerC
MEEWFTARTKQLAALAAARAGDAATAPSVVSEPSAVWLSRSGTRMGSRAVDLVVRRLAREADLDLSAHVLRHYVDGWVMWPAGVFPLLGLSLSPVPAT